LKHIADIVDRYAKLEELSKDPLVINTDGSRVDPLLELAAEMYEVPMRTITFDQRNWAMRILNTALKNDILKKTARSNTSFYTMRKPPWG